MTEESGQRKQTILGVVCILIAIAVLLIDYPQRCDVSAGQRISLTEVSVKSGDTLWNIAARYSNDQDDIRLRITAIKELNHLREDPLQPGQKLMIPYNPNARESL